MADKHKVEARGRGRRGQQAFQRLFHGLPVVDATKPLRVFAVPEDISGAKVRDPVNCVFARACKRMFQSKVILFWRSIAYVELRDEHGNPRVERFHLNGYARNAIEMFDQTHRADPAGYTLSPPSKGRTLEAQREQHALMRAEGREGKFSGKRRKRKIAVHEVEVRHGSGHVHFEKIG